MCQVAPTAENTKITQEITVSAAMVSTSSKVKRTECGVLGVAIVVRNGKQTAVADVGCGEVGKVSSEECKIMKLQAWWKNEEAACTCAKERVHQVLVDW